MPKKQNIQVKRIVQTYWTHLKNYRAFMLAMAIMVVATKILEVIRPLFYKQFFDILTGDLPVPESEQVDQLFSVLMIILALHVGGWLFWRIKGAGMIWAESRIMANLTQSALSYLHKHSYKFFTNSFTGSLVRKVNKFARSFEVLTDTVQFSFLPLIVLLTGNLYVLYTRHHLLAYILFGWVIFFLALNTWYAMWKTKFDYKKSLIDSEATGTLADSLTNANNVKLFTANKYEDERYKDVTERLRKSRIVSWGLGEVIESIQAGLMIVIEILIMWYAVKFWKQGLLTIGDFALIQSYLLGIFNQLWDFGRSIRHTYEALADADEMVEILDLPHEVVDARRAKPIKVNSGKIEFKNVFFSFQKTRRILRGFDLQIQSGEKVAFVGASGAGKSTVINLLLRFFDLERGKILIDNQNIAKATQDSVRGNISVVSQDSVLFHRTIMENMRYGNRDATDEEVMEAAKKARIHDFIMSLPDGYDTYVGERGVKLSGGERQRVSIARAIVKNAPILVLDEATSALDSESEAMIQEALEELMRGKTTIVIAHRLSTIMAMDRIIVIEKGKVTDTGSHKALLRKRSGTYKKLWEIQAGGFLN